MQTLLSAPTWLTGAAQIVLARPSPIQHKLVSAAAMMARCDSIAPLGLPVVPEV